MAEPIDPDATETAELPEDFIKAAIASKNAPQPAAKRLLREQALAIGKVMSAIATPLSLIGGIGWGCSVEYEHWSRFHSHLYEGLALCILLGVFGAFYNFAMYVLFAYVQDRVSRGE